MLLFFVPTMGREQNHSIKDNLRAPDDEKASRHKRKQTPPMNSRYSKVQMDPRLKATLL